MENLCHTLVGAALARAGLDRLSPLATPVALVGANLPDLDVVVSFWGELAYLEHHRGITHSVVGLAMQAPLLAGAAVAASAVLRRRDPAAAPARFLPLLLVASIALASHTLLDFTNSYGVKPWLPFDATWYYADLVFIVDPWMWLLLGGALFCGGRLTLGRGIFWAVLLGAMALAVASANGLSPRDRVGATPVAIWFALLGAVVVARAVWRDAPRQALAAASIAGVALYWAGLAAANGAAVSSVAATAPPGATSSAIPTLMRPDRWRALAVDDRNLHVGEALLGHGPIRDLEAIPRRLDEPAAGAALSTCAGAVTRDFDRFMFAEVEPGRDGGVTVLLRDARFTQPGAGSGFGTTRVPLDASLNPIPDPRPCPRLRGSW